MRKSLTIIIIIIKRLTNIKSNHNNDISIIQKITIFGGTGIVEVINEFFGVADANV